VEALCNLLFELSSEERLKIMSELLRKEQRLSHLSKGLDLTVSETSRHLHRLSESMLIQKNPDGSYKVTSYGEIVLSQIQGLEFASRNLDYFMEYEFNYIPVEFHERLGELSAAIRGSNILSGLERAEQAIEKAQTRVWVLTDVVQRNLALKIAGKLNPYLDCRIILPESVIPRDNVAIIPFCAPGVKKRTQMLM